MRFWTYVTRAHLDDGHTAAQLGNALRQLLGVVHGVRLGQLLLELWEGYIGENVS